MTSEEQRAAFRLRVEQTLNDAIAAGELGCTRLAGPWLFIMDGYDEDGDRVISQFTNVDNRLSDALGLIHFARIVYERAVLDWYEHVEDD